MAASAGFRRVMALALLLLVLVAVWRFAALPVWQAWMADREAVAASRDAIARFRGLAAARGRYEAALAEVRRLSGTSDALIRSPSATLAAAELQQRVKALVEAAGGTLVSAQPGAGEAAGPFTRVELGLRVLVSVEALQKVLYDLESGTPLVIVDEMQVLTRRTRSTRRRGAGGLAQDSLDQQLDVRLTVAAFVAAPPGSREAG